MPKRVAIVGCGVAGMTAAHELIQRNYHVDLYETLALPGGKARSQGVPGTGTASRRDLPSEHGFRFFPGFYKHLPDTLARIPYRAGCVFDNLVPTTHVQLARTGGRSDLLVPSRFPGTFSEAAQAFRFLKNFGREFAIPSNELRFFLRCLLQLMASCPERRFSQYEHCSWHEFIQADRMSAAYKRYIANALSHSLVALAPEHLSARTGGYILLQFLFDFSLRPGTYLDRVLNGPTNEVWIEPWRQDLVRQGVRYQPNTQWLGMTWQGTRVQQIHIETNRQRSGIEADHFVLAIPVNRLAQNLTPRLAATAPSLAKAAQLRTNWMTGLQFYLRRDVRIVHGHTNYVDSPWSLTSISQPQFWQPEFAPCYFGDGQTRGILSVIISNWNAAGSTCAKPARECTPSELILETWQQMKDHLNDGATVVLRDEDLIHAQLGPSLHYDSRHGWTNHEPLLINTVGSWELRPDCTTEFDNLYLAGDYVRTYTDLATMEAANEAARRAVNAILACDNAQAPPCELWRPDEPRLLQPLQELDSIRYRTGAEVELGEWEAICRAE